MPYTLTVSPKSERRYDPHVEEIAMPIAGMLDELERKGVVFAGDAIGPFTVGCADNAEQLEFKAERTTE